VALKRLRRWVRQGADEELDLPGTIHATAEHGYLDVQTRPRAAQCGEALMFFDVGGSMDDHIRIVEELFSAVRTEFRHMEYFYFHNCLYERVWKDNRRRHTETIPTWDVLHKYGHDYKVIFVGDASMSPYEIAQPGGSVEHWNPEAGIAWLNRVRAQWPNSAWLNPIQQKHWNYTHSIQMVRDLFGERMYPLTLAGLETMTRELSRKH
jgi:uncharacterized protein with von Willebrand factor type A (vWA) domain